MNVDYTHAPQVDHIDCEASRMVNKILILADCANLASITIIVMRVGHQSGQFKRQSYTSS